MSKLLNILALLSLACMASCEILIGYWGSAMTGSPKPDYIEEVSQWSNVAFVADLTAEGTKRLIEKAASKNMKSILSMQHIFFPLMSCAMHPDYNQRFVAFWNGLGDAKKYVVGFYIFDEPYHSNRRDRWIKVDDFVLKKSLETISFLLKSYAPGSVTMLTFTAAEVDYPNYAQLIPPNLDYFGVNCYTKFGSSCSAENIVRLLLKMKSLKYPHQKFIYTMDVYWTSKPTEKLDYQLAMRNRFWRNIIAAIMDDLGGILPFIYQDIPSSEVYGAESLPMARGEVGVYMEALQGRLECEKNDLIRWDAEHKHIIARWTSAPMCLPVCEGKNLIRRNAVGVVTEIQYNSPNC